MPGGKVSGLISNTTRRPRRQTRRNLRSISMAGTQPRPPTADHCCRVERLAVFVPAVRMVVLDPWKDGEEYGCHVRPVLGIEVAVRSRFAKKIVGDSSFPPYSRKEMRDCGWRWTDLDDHVEYSPVIVDEG